ILPDGTVEAGRPEELPGAHARQHNDTLGICLVGDFDRNDNPDGDKGPLEPSLAQKRALETLLARLRAKDHLSPAAAHPHREVVPTTACPGDCFPTDEIRGSLRAAALQPAVHSYLR